MSTIPRREPDPDPDAPCDRVERLESLLDACERFDDAWFAGNPPRIEDVLAGVPADLRDELFRELLGLELAHRAGGGGPPPAPDDYLGRFPGYSGQIIGVFQASATPGPARPAAPGRPPRPAGEAFDDDEGATEVLSPGNAPTFPFTPRIPPRPPRSGEPSDARARYKHLRLHKSGGMGQVSRVYDRLQRRVVAIKEIQPAYSRDPVSRERFLREARITGALNHPSVVPIHSVEAYSDGTPYYVMRWVDGDDFREVIHRHHLARRGMGRNSLEFRRILGQFVEVCNVIQSAHDQGVMHRDIKPVNVMIGRHGEVVVLDWGLARFLDPARERAAAAADAADAAAAPGPAPGADPAGTILDARSLDVHPELTTAGDFQGTRGYASPEHYSRDPDDLDARSDVYSLGVSLYVLLTDRNPFRDEEKPTDDQVKERVLKGAYARPSALASGIHPDLEAVCLKAMATRPGDRYQSVRGLAEDLENWLADQPVSARKPPPLSWAARQARHNSKAVIAVASVLLAVCGGLAFGNYTIAEARDRVERDLLAVLDANDRMLHSVTRGPLSTSPGAEVLRRDIAERLVASYHALLRTSPGRIDAREKLADATGVLANIHRQLGEHDRAATFYSEAIRQRLKAVEAGGSRPKHASELLALAVDAYKNVYSGQGYQQARVGWARIRADLDWAFEAADDPVIRARVLNVEASLLASLARLDEAIGLQRQAASTLEGARRSAEGPLFGMMSLELALYHINLGAQLAEAGRPAEAEAAFGEARLVSQDRRARADRALDANFLLTDGRLAQARARMLCKAPDRRAEALRELRAAADAFEALATHYPASVGYRRDAVEAALELARALRDGDAPERKRAVDACESAVRLARSVAGDSLEGARVGPLVLSLVALDEALDDALGFENHPHDAMVEARSLYEKAGQAHPNDPHFTPAIRRFNQSAGRFHGR